MVWHGGPSLKEEVRVLFLEEQYRQIRTVQQRPAVGLVETGLVPGIWRGLHRKTTITLLWRLAILNPLGSEMCAHVKHLGYAAPGRIRLYGRIRGGFRPVPGR